jgi:hypothetical protein
LAIIERKSSDSAIAEFVDTDEIEIDACRGLEAGDPSNVFRDYVLPRIEAARDEVTREVSEMMRSGRSFADAVLDVIQILPESKTRKLRTWVDEARGTHIYAYVAFMTNDTVNYGLLLTKGGPLDEEIEYEEIGEYTLPESFAARWDFDDALREFESSWPKQRQRFEEVPFVEIESKQQYDKLLSEMGLEAEDGDWSKPGLYDLRDEPPSYAMTVKEYVAECVKEEAEQTFSNVYDDDDELDQACRNLRSYVE